MLIFPLKKQWYEKIKSGEKTIEYRETKPYWTKRLYSETKKQFYAEYGEKGLIAIPQYRTFVKMLEEEKCLFGDGTEPKPIAWTCKLTLGYTGKYMLAVITKIELVNGKDTDLAIDTPVYAIHLSDVREIEHEESV